MLNMPTKHEISNFNRSKDIEGFPKSPSYIDKICIAHARYHVIRN